MDSRSVRPGAGCLHDLRQRRRVDAHGAAGNAAPLRILSGPATKLDAPFGFYEDQ
ncbi:MAG: hypothetical protein ABSB70_13310 [Candidatus Velthaea sp.]